MKIFISWSKEPAKKIALELKHFLSMALQGVSVWMSEADIAKGTRWGQEVASQLDKTNVGIICCTKNNLQEPWLHFEAGALSKSIKTGMVFPLCFDVEFSELPTTLKQFQSTRFDRDDVFNLLNAINEMCPEPMKSLELDGRFKRLWRSFEEDVRSELQVTEKNVSKGAPPLDASAPAKKTSSLPPRDERKVNWYPGIDLGSNMMAAKVRRKQASDFNTTGKAEAGGEAISNEELATLKIVAQIDGSIMLNQVAEILGVRVIRAKHYLDELISKGYILCHELPGIPDFYECSKKGAAFAIKQNWV